MIKLFIRRNEDGVERSAVENLEWNGDYIWTEGNFACDCNRAMFFAEMAGEEDSNRECGDNAFSVRIEDLAGRELYNDYQ